MFTRSIIFIVATGALYACGGGTSSGGSTAGTGVSYNSLMNQQRSLAREYALDGDVSDNITPMAQMPRSGSATYRGTGSVALDGQASRPQVAGQTNLNANFRNGQVSGRVDRFRTRDGSMTAGAIAVEGTMTDQVVLGSVKGNVVVDGTNHRISDRTEGLFLGRNAKDLVVANKGETSEGSPYALLVTTSRVATSGGVGGSVVGPAIGEAGNAGAGVGNTGPVTK